MTGVPEIEVDLDVAAEERWASLHAWRSSARALLRFYVSDLGGLQDFRPVLMGYCEEYVDKEYVAEMRGIARVLDAPEEEVVLANLYYDALKFLLGQGSFGCTGFVVSSVTGALHARNLDWTAGYRVSLWFLSLPNAEMALGRVARRVQQGGHAIPDDVVRRRFAAGRSNFEKVYRALVDDWALYDNSGSEPILLDWG